MSSRDTIVKAGLADAARLANLHERCFERGWDAGAFTRLMERDGALAYFARPLPGADPDAVILVQVAGDEAEILTISTAPEARRGGLARGLLISAASDAQKQGAQTMFLEVAEDNHAARALYDGLGFTVAGHRRAYYRARDGRQRDALILRAPLPLRMRT